MADPTPDTVATVEGLAQKLRTEALDIFDGPETSQVVRDVIEWFAGSIAATLLASPAPTLVAEPVASQRHLNILLGLAQTLDSDASGLPLASRAAYVKRELAHVCKELLDATHPATTTAPRLPLTEDEIRLLAFKSKFVWDASDRFEHFEVTLDQLYHYTRAIEAELSHPVAPLSEGAAP